MIVLILVPLTSKSCLVAISLSRESILSPSSSCFVLIIDMSEVLVATWVDRDSTTEESALPASSVFVA